MKNLFYIPLFLFFIFGCENENEIYKRTTTSMGTIVEIQIKDADRETAKDAVNKAFAEFNRIDAKYSTYKNNNLMWRINNSKEDTIELDDESSFLMLKSDELYKATRGGFDPAIGNLIDLLGFESGSPAVPSKEEVFEALEKTGWKNIEIKDKNSLIKSPGEKINFGGLAKGYAVDKAAGILEENGIGNYLINAGGEIYASGKNWSIGIRHPRKRNELIGKINPDGIGIATSGDYEQFFEDDGKRYSHIINPVSGMPADETAGVTVIAKDVTTADGLATGIFVIGPARGMEAIENLTNTEVMIIDSAGTVSYSSGFKKFLRR